MKKFLAIMMGVMLLTLAACGSDSETGEASGEEKEDQANEGTSEDQEAETDMQSLIDQLKLDATVDATSEAAAFNFSIENTGEEQVNLGFSSSQKYEIKVENADGENVYTFSADKMFTQELTSEELDAGEAFEAEETWTGIEEPGKYEMTVTMLVKTINDQSLEENPFQVTESFTIESEETDESSESDEEASDVEKHEGDGQAFREIEVTGENGQYVIKGEARVYEGSFLYRVEDGHNVQVEPTVVQVDEGAPAWSTFEIELDIPEEDLPQFGTLTLSLYEESAKDGKETNVNYIPLESFQMEE
ncbi:BsuPI-related putative proteinase inhibitor [Halobacillus sp. H74]|uniref:BsuPI-related putative proteinase inhibitor n=1 Tax=Halobacillus sp. H74 TaxID=3457436 RepID=UPI003FCD11AA